MIASPQTRGLLKESLLAEPGFRQELDRRILSAAIIAGTAAVLGAGAPARALTLETMPEALVGTVPARKGVVPWNSLSKVEVRRGKTPKFPEAITRLDGRKAAIEGYMMVVDDDDPVDCFLLTAYRISGFFAFPSGFTSVVGIRASQPVKVVDRPLTMRGIFRLLSHDGETGLLYRLDDAVPIVPS